MKMKKLAVILAVMMMGTMVMACGQKEEPMPEQDVNIESETIVEEQQTENTDAAAEEPMEADTTAEETAAPDTVAEETEAPDTVAEETTSEETEAVETVAEEAQTAESKEGGYEDNFAVDNEAAAAFADKIKAAVAAQDLEALADLTAFPVYVGLDGVGGVNSREDFIALGAEKIFTPEMVEAVGGSQTTEFPPSMAGFVLNPNGTPDIVFGVTDGQLAIKGINY